MRAWQDPLAKIAKKICRPARQLRYSGQGHSERAQQTAITKPVLFLSGGVFGGGDRHARRGSRLVIIPRGLLAKERKRGASLASSSSSSFSLFSFRSFRRHDYAWRKVRRFSFGENNRFLIFEERERRGKEKNAGRTNRIEGLFNVRVIWTRFIENG